MCICVYVYMGTMWREMGLGAGILDKDLDCIYLVLMLLQKYTY